MHQHHTLGRSQQRACDWTLFDQALFKLAIGRYASRAFDACVRAEKQRVTELREGARLGVSEPAAALTGSRLPGQSGRPVRTAAGFGLRASRLLADANAPACTDARTSWRDRCSQP
jgi:hypothetical protein